MQITLLKNQVKHIKLWEQVGGSGSGSSSGSSSLPQLLHTRCCYFFDSLFGGSLFGGSLSGGSWSYEYDAQNVSCERLIDEELATQTTQFNFQAKQFIRQMKATYSSLESLSLRIVKRDEDTYVKIDIGLKQV